MKKRFFIIFIMSIVAFSMLYSGLWKNIVDKETIAAPEDDTGTSIETGEKIQPKVKNEILFLLMGVDAEDVKKSKGTRTDTLMLTRVNFETGEINLMSIPRDTRVLVKGSNDKINHAHAYGGPSLTMTTVKDFLNIDLDYYVKVDYNVVKGVVEAIGGVKIDVPQDMKYKEYDPSVPPLDINLKKGEQILNGQQAHDFLRWRTNNTMTAGYPDGDVGRTRAQQYFMKELVKQTMKLKNIFKLQKIAETYFENVETNIPWDMILKGVMASRKIDGDNMVTATLPGVGDYVGATSYFLHDKEGTKQMVLDMFGDYLKK